MDKLSGIYGKSLSPSASPKVDYDKDSAKMQTPTHHFRNLTAGGGGSSSHKAAKVVSSSNKSIGLSEEERKDKIAEEARDEEIQRQAFA